MSLGGCLAGKSVQGFPEKSTPTLPYNPETGITKPVKTALAAITFSLSLLGGVTCAQAVQVTLYDGNPNASPASQGQLGFGALARNGFPLSSDPANPTPGYESAGSGGRTLNTAFNPLGGGNFTTEYAGYANYNPATGQFFNRTYTLDQTLGYSITFNLALNPTSTNTTANRSAFSVTITNSDGLSGIELGFEPNSIIGRNADFTPGDTATFNTSASTNYTLAVQGNNYTLSWGGGTLSGALRSYSFDPATSQPPLPFNPYRIGNFLFFGDNTGQESGTFTLGAVSVNTNTANAAVPFDFNPTFGLLILGAWTAFSHLKTKQK